MTRKNTAPAGAVSGFRHGIVSRFMHLLGAQGLKDLLNTLFLIYLARTSSTAYGEYMLAFEAGYIVLFLGEFGLNQALVNDLNEKSERKAEVLARYTLLKSVLLGLGWVGVLGFSVWQAYRPGLVVMVLVLAVGMGLEALASSFYVSCRVAGRQDQEAKLRTLASLIGFGFGFVALALGAPTVVVACFRMVENLANLAGGMAVTLVRSELAALRVEREALVRTWMTIRNNLVYLGIALAGILYNKANVFFLQRYGGTDLVAQYSVAWATVEGVAVLVSNLMLRNVLYPLLVELWRKDQDEFLRLVRTSVRWLLVAALPVMFVLCVEADRIVGLLYGPQYGLAGQVQQFMVPAVLCAFLHNLAAYVMMSRKEERPLFWMYVAGLAFNLVLCMTLVPRWPLFGAALALVLTRLGMTGLTLGHCQRRLRIVEWKSLAPIGGALLVGGLAYVLLHATVGRELAEGAAVLPFLWLGVRWHRQRRVGKAA